MVLQGRSLLLVLLVLASGIPGTAETPLIVVGTHEAPPLSGKNEPGQGIACRLVREAFSVEGYRVSFQFYPNARLLLMAENGDLEAALAGVPASGSETWLSATVFKFQRTFFYLKDSFPTGLQFDRLEDLARWRIGAIIGAPDAASMEKAGLTVDYSVTPEMDFKKLAAHRVDLVAIPDVIGLATIRNLGMDPALFGMTRAMSTSPASLVFSKNSKNTQVYYQAFLRGMDTLRKNGTAVSILEELYGKNNVPSWVLQVP